MKNVKKLDKRSMFVVGIGIFLTIYALMFLVLFFWGFSTSVKSRSEFRVNMIGIPQGWPWEWEWTNYSYVFKNFFLFLIIELCCLITSSASTFLSCICFSNDLPPLLI